MRLAIVTMIMLATACPIAYGEPIPPLKKIEEALKAYSAGIGCNFGFNPKDVVEFDVDTDGIKDFVAIFDIDAGCAGGTSTTRSSLAVLKYSNEIRMDELYVAPDMSQPSIPAFGLPRFIDRIFIKGKELWFAGRMHSERDGNNFPSIPVKSRVSLAKALVPIDSKRKFAFYYWKSDNPDLY